MIFGEHVKHMRKTAGMTQQQLADKLGFNRVSIANIERDRDGISITTLSRICEATGFEFHVEFRQKRK